MTDHTSKNRVIILEFSLNYQRFIYLHGSCILFAVKISTVAIKIQDWGMGR